eukprot:233724-Amphidinium_carterae.1
MDSANILWRLLKQLLRSVQTRPGGNHHDKTDATSSTEDETTERLQPVETIKKHRSSQLSATLG